MNERGENYYGKVLTTRKIPLDLPVHYCREPLTFSIYNDKYKVGTMRRRKQYSYWTKERVIEKLRDLSEKNGEDYLTDSNLNKNEGALYNAARRKFTSLENAIREAGFNYSKIRKKKPPGYWSKSKVIEGLKRIESEEGLKALKPSKLKENSPLYGAIRKLFKNSKEAIIEAGFDYSKVIDRKPKDYWAKDRVIDQIQKLPKEKLNYTDIDKENPTLRKVASKYFGSWKKALEKAGYNYESIYKKKEQGYWTKKRILRKINEICKEKGSKFLSFSIVKVENPSLPTAARKKFGSWRLAVEEAGFDYINEVAQSVPNDYWTKKRIIKEIKNFADHVGESSLNYTYISEKYSHIYYASKRAFGSWRLAVEEAGYNYSQIAKCKRNYWTKDMIIDKIDEIGTKDLKKLRDSSIRKNKGDLYSAAIEKFGSWRLATEEAGFDFCEVIGKKYKGYWTKKSLIKELKKMKKSDLSVSSIRKKNGTLYNLGVEYFGSWKKTIENLGYNYFEEIAIQKSSEYWTENRVIEKINERYSEGNSLQHSIINREDKALLSAAKKRFGSWKNAVEEAGFSYEDIERPAFGEKVQWYAWEECCKEIAQKIFDSSQILFKKRIKETFLIPDLQISDESLIVDAKTNAWDITGISRDIDNYLDYCKKLEFWCLEGDRNIFSSEVEIVTPEELLTRLKNIGLEIDEIEEFQRKVNMIRRGISPYEETQKEITDFI